MKKLEFIKVTNDSAVTSQSLGVIQLTKDNGSVSLNDVINSSCGPCNPQLTCSPRCMPNIECEPHRGPCSPRR